MITQFLLLVHLIGIAYWLGSLLPFRQLCTSSDTENLHFIARRFGVFALAYIGALVCAGGLFAYELLGGVSALINTAYGNVLLAKLAVVTLLLLLGALNRFRLVPSLIRDTHIGAKRLRAVVQFEIILAFIILILTSFITTSLTLPTAV